MAPTNIKRKLRKTRRSLNAMRNRIYLAKSSKLNMSNMKRNAIIKPIISDNCLIFPNKVVRSKTITRKALYESKQTCTNMSMVDNKYCYNKVIDIVECHSSETDSNTSKSVKLSSPIQGFYFENKISEYDKFQNDKTMSPSSHSEQEFSEDIFNFLLDSFPKQIKDIAPNLLLTNIIDEKKQSLRKFFPNTLSPHALSLQVKTIVNNGSNCKAADSRQMEVQADYKGFKYHQMQTAYSGNISSSAESIHSGAICMSPTVKCQNTYDSPEYSYYPHRLNYQD